MSFQDELDRIRQQSVAADAQKKRDAQIATFKNAFLEIDKKIGQMVPNESAVQSHLLTAASQGGHLALIVKVPFGAEKVATLAEPERTQTLRQLAMYCPNLAALFQWTDALGVSVTMYGDRKHDSGQGRSWTDWYLALSPDSPRQLSGVTPLGIV